MFDQIRQDRMLAKKANDKVKVRVLTTLQGQIETLKKSGKAVNYVGIVKSFIENNEFTIRQLQVHGVDSQNEVDELDYENACLRNYLPKQLTEDEVRSIVLDLVAEAGDLPVNALIGKVQGYFKQNYAGQYDGSLVTNIVRNI